MQILIGMVAVFIGYLLGSIPFGLLIVKSKTGKDIRQVESGRTGGTNAMRAAGIGAGLATAILDILKGAAAAWLAQVLSPGDHIIHILAPLGAIMGHNYSIFLLSHDENNKLRFHGGAGAMPALGGAAGLWPWSFPVVLAMGALAFFTTGIASIGTLTIGLSIIIVFAFGASNGFLPWVDVLYGVIAEFLLIWALRPNIKKLIAGNERVVKYSLNGWLRERKSRAQMMKQ